MIFRKKPDRLLHVATCTESIENEQGKISLLTHALNVMLLTMDHFTDDVTLLGIPVQGVKQKTTMYTRVKAPKRKSKKAKPGVV